MDFRSHLHLSGTDRERRIKRNNSDKCKIRRFSGSALLLTTLLLTAVTLALSADERKVETIDATATGTSTQLGQIVNVKVTIYEYSTDEDRQILINAFKKGQSQGLVNARVHEIKGGFAFWL